MQVFLFSYMLRKNGGRLFSAFYFMDSWWRFLLLFSVYNDAFGDKIRDSAACFDNNEQHRDRFTALGGSQVLKRIRT